jgi:hypothetical protein
MNKNYNMENVSSNSSSNSNNPYMMNNSNTNNLVTNINKRAKVNNESLKNKVGVNNRNNFNANRNEYVQPPIGFNNNINQNQNNQPAKRRKISFKNTRRVRNIPRFGLSDPVSNLRRKATRRVIGNIVPSINKKSQNLKNRTAVYRAHYLSRGNTISNIHSAINKNTNLSNKFKQYFKNNITRKYQGALNLK